jgi:bacterioferritin (cytochrome b1)
MAIVSLNMGNLTLEIDTLKNILAIGEKEKVVLQEELDKEKYFQKGYKNNLEIWRKNKVEAEQKNKVLIKKLQDESEKLRGNTTWLKS